MRLNRYLDLHQDGWLSDEDDPYTLEIPGFSFLAKSNGNPAPSGREQHLTYGILKSVVAGLWQWMIIKDHLDETHFGIQDSQWGLVGMGSVTPY